MWKCVAAVVLLSLLSEGLGAPLSSCDSVVKPITLSNEDILGRWMYIGGSTDLPGSRFLNNLMSDVWLNITATAQPNILSIVQTQKILGTCSSVTYDVTFKNSMMTIEQPFYLKEVYLPTNCSDCLVASEHIVSGNDTLTSLLLFSRRQSVSPDVEEAFRTQAECLQMPSPIMTATDQLCPEDLSPHDGISVINYLLEAKMELLFYVQFVKLLGAFFGFGFVDVAN